MKKSYLISFMLLGVILFSCNKEEVDNRFFWNQTKCSDPWGTGENDTMEQTIQSVKLYLEAENINVLKIDFDNSSPLDTRCKSCGCGTGQRILVDVLEEDATDMINLRFYK